MGDKKKWIFDAVLLLAITSLTLFAILHGEDPMEFLRLLNLANGWYWLAALCLIVPFVACESWIIYLLLRHVGEKPKAKHCLIYSFIGFFFSCITPAAGGGQPAQVYYMHKDGLNPGVTAPVLVVVTICYKLVLVIAGIAVLIIRPAALFLANDSALWWAFAGWMVNVIAITGFALVIFKPALVESVCFFLLDHVAVRIRRIKQERLDRWREKVERSVANYRDVTDCMRSGGKLIIGIVLISILQRAILFSITWLVLRSFHILYASSVLDVILLQAMVSLGTDMIPLPGGSGANEALFLLLFGEICGETMVLPVLIASRGISYYGQILICGIVFFTFTGVLGRKHGDVKEEI